MTTLFHTKEPKVQLVARDYQAKAVEESFRLWDSGVIGVIDRMATGTGKTPTFCMKARRWLEKGHKERVMVISYERQLVYQFAEEIEDFLGITPGIEMGTEEVDCDNMPLIVVASRQSLLLAPGPTTDQREQLERFGITDLKACNERLCKRFVTYLARGGDVESVIDEISSASASALADGNRWSRLHKFDWHYNWLVGWDECHHAAHHLKSIGHIADWFDRNPESRRSGLSATALRSDGVSVGHKMFPGIAIDFPLYHPEKKCATKEGWCVPYVQKYIEVEGVDFKTIKKIAGDFDEADLERVLGQEQVLAKLINPMLDMVGDRQTLIFSPGIEMAANVATYINARNECECPDCQTKSWHPVGLIGDGAQCKCGTLLSQGNISKRGEQAKTLNGTIPHQDRRPVYEAHQDKEFQFLSVVGLCKEGYNDPNCSCVAVFRPVSKEAKGLAEQMKGRACRPDRQTAKLLGLAANAEERCSLIANSIKPNALIIDLTGITRLGDCASTVQIYAEGLPDEVVERAEEILEQEGKTEEVSVESAIRKAQEEIDAERERIKAEKALAEKVRLEEAQKRAKAGAEVKYSVHEVGYGSNVDPNLASDSQLKYIGRLGMDVRKPITKRQAGRMLDALLSGDEPSKVAYENRLNGEEWNPVGPTDKQLWALGRNGIRPELATTINDASQLLDAKKTPLEFRERKIAEIRATADHKRLTAISKQLAMVKNCLPPEIYSAIVYEGKAKRAALP